MALTDNLQAFYKLSDTSDSSGNNRTLTNNGNVSFASGKLGNAAVFDGSNYLTNSVNISNYNGLTIAMWIKGTESGKIFFGIPSQNGGNIYISNHMGSISCAFRDNGDVVDSFNLADGEWHHVVSSLDNNNNIRLYADGSLLQLAENTNAVLSDSGSVGYIGAWEGLYGASTGQIDAVGIWNRALSDAEVAELYNSGTGLEVDPPNYRGEWDNFTDYGQDDVVSVSGVYWKLTGLGGWTVGGAPGLGYGWTLLGFIPSAVRISGNAKFQGNVKFA